jgi:uncharacterized protein involved in tolerance to divalent cations
MKGGKRVIETSFLIVWITAPSEDVGKAIATDLVERRLAACVNFL